ncbi:MAG TPA: hypothetical protein VGN47_02200 [Blastococcus sp.]|jgi:hypothetical protein|nr:hypothetical protein [Blastococcus sp.]
MERDEHNQYSPAGEVDRWGDLAQGLTHNRAGRRRAVRMLVGLAVVVVVALGLVYLLSVSGLLVGQ